MPRIRIIVKNLRIFGVCILKYKRSNIKLGALKVKTGGIGLVRKRERGFPI